MSDLSAEFPTLKNSIKKFSEPYPMINALNKAIKKAATDQKTSVSRVGRKKVAAPRSPQPVPEKKPR